MPTAWHTTNGDDCHILPYVFLSGAHPSVQMQEATFSNQARLLFSLISPLILTLNSNWLDLYQRPAYTGGLHWSKLHPTVWGRYRLGGALHREKEAVHGCLITTWKKSCGLMCRSHLPKGGDKNWKGDWQRENRAGKQRSLPSSTDGHDLWALTKRIRSQSHW